jgi:hypothetical protein
MDRYGLIRSPYTLGPDDGEPSTVVAMSPVYGTGAASTQAWSRRQVRRLRRALRRVG